MTFPFLGRIDERFLDHRRRSTTVGAMAGALVAGGLYFYRFFVQHVVSWDLVIVIVAMAVVKIAVLIWYSLSD